MSQSPLRAVSPAPRDVWREVLASDPESLVFQTPAWLDCVCAVTGSVDASRLYETADGRRFVLPMVRRRRLGLVTTEASFPAGWGMGGLVSSGSVGVDDLSGVLADLAGGRAARTSLRPNPLAAGLWAAARPRRIVAVPRLAHVLDLEGGFATVWAKRFKSEARTAVRKAERAGLTVQCDTSGALIGVFYELFRRSIDRWADQQHEPRGLARWRGQRRDPRAKFEQIARALAGACRVWVAWHEGRPAASILVLQGTNASYTRGAMDKEVAGPTAANYLLHRLAIEDACRAGCRRYHMGESGASASLAQFKTRFGAGAYPYAEYHIERLPISRLDRKLRAAVKRVIGFKDV
ncbi:MAG TPA: GNAT family N-acetyltransferase [Chloroflexota bacterium]|nr:GNAT family N-acetyltransferase [Chloroflexota bacterium]